VEGARKPRPDSELEPEEQPGLVEARVSRPGGRGALPQRVLLRSPTDAPKRVPRSTGSRNRRTASIADLPWNCSTIPRPDLSARVANNQDLAPRAGPRRPRRAVGGSPRRILSADRRRADCRYGRPVREHHPIVTVPGTMGHRERPGDRPWGGAQLPDAPWPTARDSDGRRWSSSPCPRRGLAYFERGGRFWTWRFANRKPDAAVRRSISSTRAPGEGSPRLRGEPGARTCGHDSRIPERSSRSRSRRHQIRLARAAAGPILADRSWTTWRPSSLSRAGAVLGRRPDVPQQSRA